MATQRGPERLGWFSLALVIVLLLGQFVPSASIAAIAPGPQPMAPSDLPLANQWAQLQGLPHGAIGLANFDPTVNGFQFSNQELVAAINRKGHASAWETVLTEQLQRLFGTQVCIGETGGTCVLTAAAQNWLKTQLERMDLGVAEGMAAAVLALWQPQPQRRPWWQQLINLLLEQTVFSLGRNLFDLQTLIANLFLMQSVPEVFQPTQAIRDRRTPTEILLAILDSFLKGGSHLFTMGIYRRLEGQLSQGHSLTPYRIEDRGQGKYWVYVYDSNYPAGRSNSPAQLHVEFDTLTDSWSYRPTVNASAYQGNATTQTLDLTQLSWQQPDLPHTPSPIGPLTCPFCKPLATTAPSPSVDITLVGQGTLTVRPYGAMLQSQADPEALAGKVLVPFKGGLNQQVPNSYHLPVASVDQPLEIRLEASPNSSSGLATLQLAGPGYTANLERTSLPMNQPLILYFWPRSTGPELTLVTPPGTAVPQLSVHLSDDTITYEFDSSTAETGFSRTQRQVSKSSSFFLGGPKRLPGQRLALVARTDLQRIYFADDQTIPSQYQLTVKNRLVIRDRIQVGDRQPDLLTYRLTYEEELRAVAIEVDGATQAFVDYQSAFIDPVNRPRQELVTELENRNFPIWINYEPKTDPSNSSGPLKLTPSGADPIARRVFQATLQKGYGLGKQ